MREGSVQERLRDVREKVERMLGSVAIELRFHESGGRRNRLASRRVSGWRNRTPPPALLLNGHPELVCRFRLYSRRLRQQGKRGLQHLFERLRKRRLQRLTKTTRHLQQHVGHRARPMQRPDGWRRQVRHRHVRARFGESFDP